MVNLMLLSMQEEIYTREPHVGNLVLLSIRRKSILESLMWQISQNSPFKREFPRKPNIANLVGLSIQEVFSLGSLFRKYPGTHHFGEKLSQRAPYGKSHVTVHLRGILLLFLELSLFMSLKVVFFQSKYAYIYIRTVTTIISHKQTWVRLFHDA